MPELLDANLQYYRSSGRGILAPTTLVGNTNICLGERLRHSVLSSKTEFNIQSKCSVNSRCTPSPTLPGCPYIWSLASQATVPSLIQKTRSTGALSVWHSSCPHWLILIKQIYYPIESIKQISSLSWLEQYYVIYQTNSKPQMTRAVYNLSNKNCWG